MARVLCVAGARPNFMKIAPILRALRARPGIDARLLHTGQHYDDALSRVFFEDLQIPRPDRNLEVGSGSHAQQTAEIMRRFEGVLQEEQPQVVLVVGDVNSTIACTLVAAKFRLKQPFDSALGLGRDRPLTVHVEAGLRSMDREMPEEINRLLTDSISDLLYISDPAGIVHLQREGIEGDRVQNVGNVMIDTLNAARERAMRSDILNQLQLKPREYALLTLHRPSNVDCAATLRGLLQTLDELSQRLRIVFPVHPRTKTRIAAAEVTLSESRWTVTEPVGYLEFLNLMANAKIALTDSGGIQEETTVLGVPCITLRENTERPITLTEGTNVLVGTDRTKIVAAFNHALDKPPIGKIPDLWDGKAAERIADHLVQVLTAIPAA